MPRLPAGPRRRPAARYDRRQQTTPDRRGRLGRIGRTGRHPAAAGRPGHRRLPRLGLLHDPPRRHARGDRRPLRHDREPPGRGEQAARQRQPDLRRRVAAGAVIERAAASRTVTIKRKHRVVAGDSLIKIARTYGVRPAVIARANRLPASLVVRLGDTLVVPVTRKVRQLCGAGAARTRSPVAPTRPRSSRPRRATGPSWRTAACRAGPRCAR